MLTYITDDIPARLGSFDGDGILWQVVAFFDGIFKSLTIIFLK